MNRGTRILPRNRAFYGRPLTWASRQTKSTRLFHGAEGTGNGTQETGDRDKRGHEHDDELDYNNVERDQHHRVHDTA